MDNVLFSVESGIAGITINRPERSNALNRDVINELRRALQSAAENKGVRLLTITGAGEKIFCAGVDLKASLSAGSEGQAFGRRDFHQLLLEITQFPKPTIALARGHVMGGGMGIVLACDLCLACDDVHFSTPEIAVGLFPMMVMGLLYRNVGRKKATELMYLGERVTASQALELGIINYAYGRDQFEKAAAEFVGKIASRSSTILSMGKRAISIILDKALAVDEEYLESALAEVMATEDSKEGIRAFVEKRPPRWN